MCNVGTGVVVRTPQIPLSHAHQNRVEPGLVNPGSTQFYEFRSYAPISRALCRLVTSVIAKMAYQDSLLVAILFTFLRLQATGEGAHCGKLLICQGRQPEEGVWHIFA